MNTAILLRTDLTTECHFCGAPLMNGIDTFGPAWEPSCSECWYANQEQGQMPVYGFFTGGDPRTFCPDPEMCSEEEIANHEAACKLWDEAEKRGEKPEPEACPSGWVRDESGKAVMHVLKAPYGIGVQMIGGR